jgi:hypothetical protein
MQIGAVLLPASTSVVADSGRITIGVALYLSMGMLFGVLYAACQQDVPVRGLIAVGVFYGFVLWIVGRFLISPFVRESFQMIIRSWSWLLACLLYGIGLATAAVWARRRRPAGNVSTVPID